MCGSSPAWNRFAASIVTFKRGEPISSISRRAFFAESTTLLTSGSKPRVTPAGSAISTAARTQATMSRQASGVSLSGWRRHMFWAIARAGADVDHRRAQRLAGRGQHAQPPHAVAALRGLGMAHVEGALDGAISIPRAAASRRIRWSSSAAISSGMKGRPAQSMLSCTQSSPQAFAASSFPSSVGSGKVPSKMPIRISGAGCGPGPGPPAGCGAAAGPSAAAACKLWASVVPIVSAGRLEPKAASTGNSVPRDCREHKAPWGSSLFQSPAGDPGPCRLTSGFHNV